MVLASFIRAACLGVLRWLHQQYMDLYESLRSPFIQRWRDQTRQQGSPHGLGVS